MFRYPSDTAPGDTWKVIGAYETRRSSFIGQCVFVASLIALLVGAAAIDKRLSWLILPGIALLVGLNWVLYWYFPTRRYRKYVAAGHILLIDSEALQTFRRAASDAIDELAKTERKRLEVTVRRLWLAQADQATIDTELERIKGGIPA